MHIVIGDTPSIRQPPQRVTGNNGGLVEARVLAVRPPRRKIDSEPEGGERRRQGGNTDPVNGKVLILLAPEGNALPADLASDNYRVFVKIVPR